MCLRPDDRAASTIASLTEQALRYAGRGHWPTGATRASHFTVRVLDHYRARVLPQDPVVERWTGAMRRAAKASGPPSLRVTGLTLTRGSVMASAEPDGPAADAFASALSTELGEDGWYEAGFDRSIWYANLIHFTGPVSAPRELVDWVGERRRMEPVEVSTRVELLDWRFDGQQMVPVVLAQPEARARSAGGRSRGRTPR
jgi:hypothetical protein